MTPRAEEMVELLAIRKREGLTYAELVERTGVARSTLSWWGRRLRREGQAIDALVEIEVADHEIDTETSGVSIEVGSEIMVRVDREFDAPTLRRVLDSLVDC